MVPTKDSQLVAWTNNASTRFSAAPATFDLTAGEATTYATLSSAFVTAVSAVETVREAGIRSKNLVSVKNAAKAALLDGPGGARELYAFIQKNQSVADGDKDLVGVLVPKNHNTPSPVPDVAPSMEVVSVSGHDVEVRFSDSSAPGSRAMPPTAIGINVFSFVGETAPTDPREWSFDGGIGTDTTTITFPPTVAPGAKVFITAFYFNRRKQSGPAAQPISTNLQGGSALPLAA